MSQSEYYPIVYKAFSNLNLLEKFDDLFYLDELVTFYTFIKDHDIEDLLLHKELYENIIKECVLNLPEYLKSQINDIDLLKIEIINILLKNKIIN